MVYQGEKPSEIDSPLKLPTTKFQKYMQKLHENMSANLNCRDFSETLDESD